MDDLILLSLLSCAMFVGSYIAGILPIILPFSENKLRLVTITGAGLLVGTALAVIIPEGVNSIYKSHLEEAHPPKLSSPASSKSFESDSLKKLKRQEKSVMANTNDSPTTSKALAVPPLPEELDRVRRAAEVPGGQVQVGDEPGHQHGTAVDVHGAVGLALLAGFVLMLLVDQLAQGRSSSTVSVESGLVVQQSRYKMTATVGLVVHAAADGVALGAASGSSHDDVQFIVFVAIMLHKAPAALGLVTFLLHEGFDRTRTRRHLLAFSLAAPLAAFATFAFLSQSGAEPSLHSTGVLLLFSAGTFLYVATVHVLPEVAAGGHAHAHTGPLHCNELLALVGGALLPALLTVTHSH